MGHIASYLSSQRRRQGDREFEVMLHFIGSSKPAWATYREFKAFLGYIGRFGLAYAI